MRARAFDRELLPFAAGVKRWRVLVGVDLETSPGTYAVSIEADGSPSVDTATYELVVAPRSRVMQRRVAAIVSGIHVHAEFFDQVFDRREPAVGRVTMGVAGVAFAIFGAGGRMQRIDAGTTGRNRW